MKKRLKVMQLHRVAVASVVAMGFILGSGCPGHPELDAETAAEAEEANVSHEAVFPVTVLQPYPELGVQSGRVDINGRPVRIPCMTCHHAIVPDEKNALAVKLERFHAGIELDHGGLTCLSCHVPPRFETFKLASGLEVDYAQVVQLCEQCHGAKRTDYEHGAHGGMNGYWDLTAGPRTRNSCLDCHNAHRPAYQPMQPAPHPIYRFLED